MGSEHEAVSDYSTVRQPGRELLVGREDGRRRGGDENRNSDSNEDIGASYSGIGGGGSGR